MNLSCYKTNLLGNQSSWGEMGIGVKWGLLYMSAHVLLNSLNVLGKRDKMSGMPSILSLFRNKFNKFNNTRACMLDS